MKLNRGFLLLCLFGVFGVAVAGAQEPVQEAIPNWPAPPFWSPATRPAAAHGVGTESVEALPTPPLPFVGIAPCRIADTRSFAGPYGPPPLSAGVPRNFTLSGQCGIAGTASAVSLNVTVTNTAGPGFILIYPAGGVQPTVSTLNYVASQTIANAAIVPLGSGGAVTVIAGVSGTDLILDTNGYYAGSVVTSLTAGTGLTGTATTGDVTLGIANGGVGTAQLSTTGSSNGQALVSNGAAVNWGSPASFTGALSGEVTGTQGATVVSNAVSANTPSAIVRRDGSGNFSAQTVTLGGNLALPATTSSTAGVITSGGSPFLHSFGTDNTFVGLNAGNFMMTGGYNTASGVNALFSNTTGTNNTASGINALESNTTGVLNTASGASALESNTIGCCNTASGASALEFSTGSQNTANGVGALQYNTTGGNNTASGVNALFSNTTGNSNTASGVNALQISIGSQNTANGLSALGSNTTGGNNTASGVNALFSNTIGSNNIAIGSFAGSNLTTGNNNIAIGNVGVAAESLTTRIGSSQTRAFIAGAYAVVAAGGAAVYVNSSGQLGTGSSSRRFKEDIQDMADESDGLMRLRPVAFRYKPDIDPTGTTQYGLIAEEVAEVYPHLVGYDQDGQLRTVHYHLINALMLNEVQKQHRTVEAQEKTIEQQKAEIEGLKARMSRLEARLITDPGP